MQRLLCSIAVLSISAAAAVLASADGLGDRHSAKANTAVLVSSSPSTLKPGSTFQDCTDGCPEMVVVPAGQFRMGSAQYAREQPQHTVGIPALFAVSKFDVTFDEWAACVREGGCAGNPEPPDEGWGRGQRPVINVSWADANQYTSWLAKKTGQDYRLLTEAEWEYVARAGSTTTYSWGNTIDCSKANYDGGPGSACPAHNGTQPVGHYPPNQWGLYDTIGNVWQWCADNWHPDYRGAPEDGSAWLGGVASMSVLRGGAWNYRASGLRSADRNWLPKQARTNFLGVRIARPLTPDIATR